MQAVTQSYSDIQISEARQAIYRLSVFPVTRDDVRIRTDLVVILAQKKWMKIIGSLTCDCCCSRRMYDAQSKLSTVKTRIMKIIHILYVSKDLEKKEMSDMCEAAIQVFNRCVQNCSDKRQVSGMMKNLDHLKIDLQSVIQKEQLKTLTPQQLSVTYRRKANNAIDYDALFGTVRTSAPGPSSSITSTSVAGPSSSGVLDHAPSAPPPSADLPKSQ